MTLYRDYKADNAEQKFPLRWNECHNCARLAPELTAAGHDGLRTHLFHCRRGTPLFQERTVSVSE